MKEKVEAEGIEWVDTPVAGGSGVQAMTVLRSRVTAGNPPAAVQMLGYDILDWAELDVVANLNELAEQENWDQVIPDALQSDTMVEVFERMETLRGFVDKDFSGRDWNLASAMVIKGQAAFQMMGDFAKGEFLRADQVPGEDFMGFRTPGTKGSVTFNADQFVMFAKESAAKRNAQKILAKNVMDPEFQVSFNVVKGSVPARTDVPDDEFTIIGKEAMKDLDHANKNETLFGSLAHGHGGPSAVKEAVFDVVSAHFNGQYTAEEAAEELAKAVAAAE